VGIDEAWMEILMRSILWKDLADKINKILEIGNKTGNAGKRFVEQFRWTKIVDKIDNLIKNSD
jgi:glycosyltransferase involved in cell wall biosynthesis